MWNVVVARRKVSGRMTLYSYSVLFIVGVVRSECRVDCFEGNFCWVGGFLFLCQVLLILMVSFLNLSLLWCVFIARGLICVDAVLVEVRKSMMCVKL